MIGFTSKPTKALPVNRLAELFAQAEKRIDSSSLKKRLRRKFYLDQSIFDDAFEYRLGYWRGIGAAAEAIFGDEFRKAYQETEFYKTNFKTLEEIESEYKKHFVR